MTDKPTLLFSHAPGAAALPDVIVRCGRDGRFLWVSDSIECAAGVSPAWFVGRTHRELELPREIGGARWSSLLDEVFRTGRAAKLAFTVDEGGSTRCLELRVMPDRGGANAAESATGVVRDVTGLLDEAAGIGLRHDTEAGTAREDAEGPGHERLMESVGRLAGGIAHDINNVLTVIKGGVELMLGSGTLGEDQMEDLKGIDAAADRASALTDRLLAFGRRPPLQPAVVDLNEIVGRVERMARGGLGEDVDLRVERDPAPASVFVDEGQMEKVILELVQNARAAMPRGGTIRVSTRLADERPGAPRVELAVSDTGEGIAPEILPRIFDPFFTTRPGAFGAGLGLSTVFGIVRQSGGTCSVRSTPGAGTRFVVRLPRAASAAVEPASPPPLADGPGGHELVLVVEDDDSVRSVARRILVSGGYHVMEARTPSEAILLAGDEAGPIHLMLTDVGLPEVSGTTLARRIREMHPEIRVLFMSGHHDEALSRHGLEGGAPFVHKPFTVEGLRESVREILRAA